MNEDKPGWDGPEIPIEMQAVTLMKYYRKAVSLCAANFMGLHKMVEARIAEHGEESLAKAFENDPVYMRILGKLAANHNLYGDGAFRKSTHDLLGEWQDEHDDMITWFAFYLWVDDGATFPDWMMEMHDMIDRPIGLDELLEELDEEE